MSILNPQSAFTERIDSKKSFIEQSIKRKTFNPKSDFAYALKNFTFRFNNFVWMVRFVWVLKNGASIQHCVCGIVKTIKLRAARENVNLVEYSIYIWINTEYRCRRIQNSYLYLEFGDSWIFLRNWDSLHDQRVTATSPDITSWAVLYLITCNIIQFQVFILWCGNAQTKLLSFAWKLH